MFNKKSVHILDISYLRLFVPGLKPLPKPQKIIFLGQIF